MGEKGEIKVRRPRGTSVMVDYSGRGNCLPPESERKGSYSQQSKTMRKIRGHIYEEPGRKRPRREYRRGKIEVDTLPVGSGEGKSAVQWW